MTRDTLPRGSPLETKLVQMGNYKFTGRVLGRGSFAVVREAIHTQLRVHVSVKTVDLKKCNNYMLKNYLREALILQNLNHPFIMRLFETMKHNNTYYMVTEVVQGGDLCSYVQQKKGKAGLVEHVTRRFSRQIASAIKYLHLRGIVHRDLKLENIMLDSSRRNVKLIDFGLTNNWSLDCPLKTLCGSPEYAAPELFIPGTVYGPEVDMWALGVIMFAMSTGRLPFPCLSVIMKVPDKKSQFLKTINHGLSEAQTDLIIGYSAEFTQLIKGLMNPNWEERLKIKDIFNDPWLTNRHHWVDIPHCESLDSYEQEKIIRQLSFKLKIPIEKLKSELKLRPCGEIGGVFNIITHQEISDRYNILDIKPRSETSTHSFSKDTWTKKRSSKQVFEGPIKISLLGNAMKLNDTSFTGVPVCRSNFTPTSSASTTESSCNGRKPENMLLLPKARSFKTNCFSSPFSKQKNEPRTANKSLQVNTASKKKTAFGKTILPSKFRIKFSERSLWEQEQVWQNVI